MSRYNSEALTFTGGECEAADAGALLEAFALSDMPFMLVETMDDGLRMLGTDRDWPVGQAPGILRLHVFGEGGDLKLRRDGHRLLWTYIGFEQPDIKGRDFWAENRASELVEDAELLTALLWGRYDDSLGYWYDDRVRGAGDRLVYLDNPAPQVVSVTARLRDATTGQTVAYWTRALQPAEDGA
jgi:hypothetical protein